MAYVIKFISWIIATLIWAVVGFYIWIPMLIVSSFLYTAGTLVDILNYDELLNVAQRFLENTSSFYPAGFVSIYRGVWDKSSSRPSDLGDALSELVAFLFWAVIFLVVSTLIWGLIILLIVTIAQYYADNRFSALSTGLVS